MGEWGLEEIGGFHGGKVEKWGFSGKRGVSGVSVKNWGVWSKIEVLVEKSGFS